MRVLDLRRPPPLLAIEAPGRETITIESARYHAELSQRWPGYDLLMDYPGYRVLHDGREVAYLVDATVDTVVTAPTMHDTTTTTIEGAAGRAGLDNERTP